MSRVPSRILCYFHVINKSNRDKKLLLAIYTKLYIKTTRAISTHFLNCKNFIENCLNDEETSQAIDCIKCYCYTL